MGATFTGGIQITGGVNIAASGGSGSDPYFSNVVLLLHGDGVNGGTTITDSSSYARTPSSRMNVITSNEKQLFGQNTIKSNNQPPISGGSVLQYAPSTDFAYTYPYTFEFWLFLPSSFTTFNFMSKASSTVIGVISGSNTIEVAGSWTNYGAVTPSMALTPNSWNYFAMCVNANKETSIWINGTRQFNYAGLGWNPDDTAKPLTITDVYTRDDITAAAGYLAEIRYTKGVARYSGATIPVQSAPWPNS